MPLCATSQIVNTMQRLGFFRDQALRPSIPTEPLTPKEWAAFGEAIDESPEERIPEHLRFHNPAWNLSLLRTLAQKRWEEQGGEGQLEEPGPIDTSTHKENEDVDMLDETGVPVNHGPAFSVVGAANILPEGRMRKKAKLDYTGMFMPVQGFDDEDGRRNYHRTPGDIGGRAGDHSQLEQGLDSLPKPQHKRRGRPPRKSRDALEAGSEMGDLPKSEDTPAAPASPKMEQSPDPTSIQKERRRALIGAGNKMPGMEWLKRFPGAKDGQSSTPPVSTNGLVLPSNDNKSAAGYKKRVSLAPGSSQSAQKMVTNTVKKPVGQETPPNNMKPNKQGASLHEKTSHKLPPSLMIPSSLLTSDHEAESSPSPSSSEYESVSSADLDTTFPAGQLRLADLPRGIVATIPKPLEHFSRSDHISPIIGGNTRSVIATVSPKMNSPFKIKGYMAIQPAWNPHAPKKAGENGSMMQLSTTSTNPISKTQENFPLFVARGAHRWEYCGQYKVAEVVAFSAFENWMHLSTGGSKLLKHWGEEILQKKYEWSKNLFMENCGWTEVKWHMATVEDIMSPILDGRVPMHWVHLQCVGFDLGLYEALLTRKVKHGLAASKSIIL
ncbi:hypothetical protein TWF481_010270 [Arthrobotrys musiformis]|uniref:DUF6697 domain-containing protein n=1 Tax=Arthrobotrys musiformis TaxID=47236 RepID=A0AAV9W358_9PEZI